MKTENRRRIDDVVKGLGYLGVSAGFAYLGAEYFDWTQQILKEQGQAGGSPPTAPLYMV